MWVGHVLMSRVCAGFLDYCAQMYVSGQLADTEHVIIDIGTGYYIEKVCARSHLSPKHVQLARGL